MSSSSSIDVLIIDDHPTTRDAIREAIESRMGMAVVGETGSAREAFSLIQELQPDIATVDLSLREGHGLGLLKNVQSHGLKTRGVVFTMYDEKVYAERAIRAGASGYVMKASSSGTLLDAIRRVDQGEVYLSSEMTSRILSKVIEGEDDEVQFPIDELTDRELQVFEMIGQGLTVDEIAEVLNLTKSTVQTHRKRARKKLGFDSLSKLIKYAVGWTMTQPQEETDSSFRGN